jgi:hypothetical protein
MHASGVESSQGELGPPSFWLLADNSVDLGSNLDRTGTFVAFLKHSLLFHERLLLSDSLVVNTPNFRRAIQADPALREYMTKDCLVIARRKQERSEEFVELIALRESFLPKKSMNGGFDPEPTLFLADEDLLQLQRFASPVPYELSQVSGYYTASLKELLGDRRFLDPLGVDADTVCEAILQRIDKHGYVDQTFFKPGLPESLPTIVGETIWNRHSTTVHDFETAYYSNAIPATVGADVVFSHEHARQREILRHLGTEKPGSVRIDLSREAKSLYEAALSAMTAARLARLRESDEFKEFQKTLKKLRSIQVIDDPELDLAVQEIYVALDEYHRRIDDELRMRRFFDRGSRLLDRWNLRGFLKDGAWLLRIGAEAVSRKPVRAVVATSLAAIVHPALSALFLKYYALGGIKKIEKTFDDLPAKLNAAEKRRMNLSYRAAEVNAHLAVAPRTFKDSIYGEPDLPLSA